MKTVNSYTCSLKINWNSTWACLNPWNSCNSSGFLSWVGMSSQSHYLTQARFQKVIYPSESTWSKIHPPQLGKGGVEKWPFLHIDIVFIILGSISYSGTTVRVLAMMPQTWLHSKHLSNSRAIPRNHQLGLPQWGYATRSLGATSTGETGAHINNPSFRTLAQVFCWAKYYLSSLNWMQEK